MNQNDISKRHQNDILEKQGLFGNIHDGTFYACAQKLGKVAAAIHLVADIIDTDASLATSLHTQSLATVRLGYGVIGKHNVKSDTVMAVVIGIDELTALVDIGSITQKISRMNADIITGELTKIRDILVDTILTMKTTEQSLVLSQYAVHQPTIQSEIITDLVFDAKLKDFQSKRHQNDIKTTLIREVGNQNDIINDTDSIKTTSINDIPRVERQKDILSLIKSSNEVSLHIIKMKFPDLGDKTIQRELASLIEMGLIRKEGDKRWTTYRAV